MKKISIDNNIVYYAFLILLVTVSIFSAIYIKDYLGYATLQSQAGNVTEVNVQDTRSTFRWHGLFGLAFVEPGFGEEQSVEVTPGAVSSKIFVFECVDPNNLNQELYASFLSNVSFSNVTPGDYSMVDSLFPSWNTTDNDSDNAFNSFLGFANVSLGSSVIEAPAIYTHVNGNPDGANTFYTAILNASGDLLLATKFYQESQTSFKGSATRFQTLLPTPNSSIKYFFFPDPNDDCPSGISVGQLGDSIVAGYVLDSNTSLPIANATVSAGGNITFTDSTGLFNMTVQGDRAYNLISIKDGYVLNITLINTTVGRTTFQNLTMTPDPGLVGPNSTISGFAKDNNTNASLSNVTINIHSFSTVTNDTGNFTFNVSEGTYVITAMRPGYINFIDNFSVADHENLSYFINMTSFTQGEQQLEIIIRNNGSLQGYASDNVTNNTLDNVRVSVAGVVNFTNASGFYNLTSFEGSTNLVATRAGYHAHHAEVNITAFNITTYNFSMGQIIPQAETLNGSIVGYVRNNENTPLSEAFVAAAGKDDLTNITGQYELLQIPPGTHNIIATRDGFINFVGEVNVSEGNVTEFNITMETIVEAGLGDGLGEGQGPGDGPGLGPGQGPGTGIIAQTEQPTTIIDYDISVRKIIEKLKQDNFITVDLEISNYLENTVNIGFSVEGSIRRLIRYNKNRMTVDGSGTGQVTLTILGNAPPGIYEGFFVISGDIDDRIPIYILLSEKDRLDIEGLTIDISTKKKKVRPGSKLNYKIDIQNLLEDETYRVDLDYFLEGINNNVSIPVESENIFLLTAFTLVKSFVLPDDLPLGEYLLKARARYFDKETVDQTIVEIREPFYKYALFGVIPLWLIFLIAGVIGGLIYAGYYIKKKAEDKKRYHIDLDYTQLPKAGPRSAYVGLIAETNKKTYFDLDLMQIHTLVAGSTGSGKSVASQGIVEEALLKGTAVMVFDPTVQWTGFLSRCTDKKFLALYPKFGFKKSDARSFGGNIHQVLDAREMIEFKKYIKPGEINVFVVNKLETKDYEIFVSNTIREVFKENMPESRQLKLLLVFDEFHRLLPKYGGTGQVLIQVERAAREFRKWGVGLVLISQVISDFQAEVLANLNTQIQMRTKDEGDLTRTKNEYGERYLQSLVKASVGAGMVENSAYNKGKPYFVQFRPLLHNTGRVSDEDLENYNKYNKVIDDLEYQLEQLEKEGIDIFDLQLELKLALDKVKAGSFNMVDIYLEGLKPRVQAQWDKIGKKPKAKVVRRISENELKKELEKAKKWRDKQEGKEGAQETPAPPTAEPEKKKEEKPEEPAPLEDALHDLDERGNKENEARNLAALKKAKEAREKEEARGEKPKEHIEKVGEKGETPKEEEKKEEKDNSKENKGKGGGAVENETARKPNPIIDTIKEVDNAIRARNKPALIELYKKLPGIYKQSSKDVKLAILKRTKLIQQVLAR